MSGEGLRHWKEFEGIIEPGSEEEQLLDQLDPERMPAHIAIIMDGNGRWARSRKLLRVQGHRAGIEAVRDTLETATRLGLHSLTLYAFSMENWKRPKEEVSTLMKLLRKYLKLELENLMKNDIRFTVLGRMAGLDEVIQKELREAEAATAGNGGLMFNIALNYGGRAEIVDACRSVCRELIDSGASPDDLDDQAFAGHLYTAGQPDPDLMIRTSGEFRISNFLLWQIAYTEIWFTDTMWPDFRKKHLFQAIIDYQKRDRRYGGV
jgi:undecaprenyl diphosphate synthase